MPCRDYADSEPRYIDRPETVQKLCAALTQLDRYNIPIPNNCVQWWSAHKKEDIARKQAEKDKLDKEAKKKAILAKLSEAEKKLLGL